MGPTLIPLEKQSQRDLAFLDEAIKMVCQQHKSPSRSHLQTDLCYYQAEEAALAQEIPVGCVFVRNGKIIAKGRNRTNETRNVCRINSGLSLSRN